MAFVFVIGGARSGKSSFAVKLAERHGGRRTYIATAEALDHEMEERIRKHKDERGPFWETIEEPKDIVGNLDRGGVVLIDCVTLWLSNLLGAGLDDGAVITEAKRLVKGFAGKDVIAVSNELGLGIVPENKLARRFRDIAGKVNQILAEKADEVYFVAAGIPLKMK